MSDTAVPLPLLPVFPLSSSSSRIEPGGKAHGFVSGDPFSLTNMSVWRTALGRGYAGVLGGRFGAKSVVDGGRMWGAAVGLEGEGTLPRAATGLDADANRARDKALGWTGLATGVVRPPIVEGMRRDALGVVDGRL